MNTTMVTVARYHLVRPNLFTVVPWAVLAFSFLVNLVIFAEVPVSHHEVLTPSGLISVANPGRDTGGLATVFIFFFVMGVTSIGKSLPFGLTLGFSRRSYYAGTGLLGVTLAAADAVGLTVLQAIERATNGWGATMSFFRVPYLLDGPWYETWVTCFVGMAMLFLYGMWYGIVYRRWGTLGTIAFIAAQVLVVLVFVLAVATANAWPSIGGFFRSLTALGLTGILAALAGVLLAGGHATIRRATV